MVLSEAEGQQRSRPVSGGCLGVLASAGRGEGVESLAPHLDVDAPLTHDLRRLLLLLAAAGVSTEDLEPLAQLTVYAVQFRYDADPNPLGLDRAHYNRQVKALLARVNALILPGSDRDP